MAISLEQYDQFPVPAPIDVGGARVAQEKRFTASDSRQLFYRYWPATSAVTRGAVVLFHRGHEHSGRLMHLVEELDMPEFAFFAWDARGLGHSRLDPEPDCSSGRLVRDVKEFSEHITTAYGIKENDISVVAQSISAVLVSAWVHDYAPKIRCMALASPAFSVKLYVPFAWPGLKLMYALRGSFSVNSYVKGKFLSHDAERIESYDNDPLIVRPIAVNLLLELKDLANRLVRDAKAITTPTQLLISGNDWVVHHRPQHRFFDDLGADVKERHTLPGFYHDTLGEKDRHLAVGKLRSFILNQYSGSTVKPLFPKADQPDFTAAEAASIAAPLPRFSLKGLYWSSVRLGLRIGGWFSKGIWLGHKTGFDSGSTLDYVYENHAYGRTPLGRAIDRAYLDAIGWRGIRKRKIHIEQLLHDASGKLLSAGLPVRVLDIAAGHGRYILSAFENAEAHPDSICLRDYSERNVEAGSELIKRSGLEKNARFEKADAFDRDSIANVNPRPTLGVVSGLYELFANNDLVRRSLSGLSAAIEDGGYLIYTGQPWHPQLEFIGRALTSHRKGQPWVMRRRTQAELDQLVADAGFEKVDQWIDDWGIFSVSLARKIAA